MDKVTRFVIASMDVNLGGPFAPASSIAAISLSVSGSWARRINKLDIGKKQRRRTDIGGGKIFTEAIFLRTCSRKDR